MYCFQNNHFKNFKHWLKLHDLIHLWRAPRSNTSCTCFVGIYIVFTLIELQFITKYLHWPIRIYSSMSVLWLYKTIGRHRSNYGIVYNTKRNYMVLILYEAIQFTNLWKQMWITLIQNYLILHSVVHKFQLEFLIFHTLAYYNPLVISDKTRHRDQL
jgi:hypothetical protein